MRVSELRRIERNIQHLRESRLISQDTPELALSVANMPLLYTHLNDMERICFDLLENYEVVLHDRLYCGEFTTKMDSSMNSAVVRPFSLLVLATPLSSLVDSLM